MKKKLNLAVLLVGLSAATSQAAVIFQDDFSGLSTTDLNGQALDVNNQDSQTWRANSQFEANGTVSGGSQAAAYLDFAPTAGTLTFVQGLLGDDLMRHHV